MMRVPTAEQYDAYRALLASPDLPCLPRRTRRYTYAGDAAKRDVIKRNLGRAYVRYRMLDAGESAEIVSVRRSALRLVRRKQA